jgi:hypothetical protein
VYHTYAVAAPDPFVAPYLTLLLDRTPKPQPKERGPGAGASTRTDAVGGGTEKD